jgi:uncharacterized membrane protein
MPAQRLTADNDNLGSLSQSAMRGYRHRASLRKSQTKATLTSVWPLWLIVGLFLVVYGSAAWYGLVTRPKAYSVVKTRDVPLSEGQDLRIELSQLERGQLYLFHYPEAPSRQNRFIVERAADGSLSVALATCTACYSSPRAHYPSDAGLVCGRCNHPMHAPNGHEKTARASGCGLIPVPYELDDDYLLVKAVDVVSYSNKEKS